MNLNPVTLLQMADQGLANWESFEMNFKEILTTAQSDADREMLQKAHDELGARVNQSAERFNASKSES